MLRGELLGDVLTGMVPATKLAGPGRPKVAYPLGLAARRDDVEHAVDLYRDHGHRTRGAAAAAGHHELRGAAQAELGGDRVEPLGGEGRGLEVGHGATVTPRCPAPPRC